MTDCYKCAQTLENVTCEGVLFITLAIGCSRLLSAANDLTTSQKKLVKKNHSEYLMRKRPKQVSLFFDAAHSTSSEVIDFH